MSNGALVVAALAVFIAVLWISEWFRRKGPDRSRDARPDDHKHEVDAGHVDVDVD